MATKRVTPQAIAAYAQSEFCGGESTIGEAVAVVKGRTYAFRVDRSMPEGRQIIDWCAKKGAWVWTLDDLRDMARRKICVSTLRNSI